MRLKDDATATFSFLQLSAGLRRQTGRFFRAADPLESPFGVIRDVCSLQYVNWARVEYEVSPEPSPEEREALDQALARLLEERTHPAYGSAWREAGVREGLGLAEDDT